MDNNQIIIIAIIILFAIIIVFISYFLITFIFNKGREKKQNKKYDSKNLIEEESLMNMMDEKKNLELSHMEEKKNFLNDNVDVNRVSSKVLQENNNVNPFGIDLKTANFNNAEEDRSKNKFIK